jgi:hypothetical protein
MKPLAHTGDSANIAYYTEPTSGHGDLWAEVLRNDVYWTGVGKYRRSNKRKRPVFYVTVYRIGTGKVATRTWTPRSDVPPGALDEAVVTRLVRLALSSS